MKKFATLTLGVAVAALCSASALAGMNDERVQKRDEIWKTEALDHSTYESKTPDSYSTKEVLPQRQNTKRVMG